MSILSTNKKLISIGAEYSAGQGINITDHIISVVESAVGEHYSAGPNIDIYDVEGQPTISSKDWANDIANASANAYEQAIAQIPAPQDLSYISGRIDTNTSGIDYISSVCLTAHQDWTDTIKGASSYSYEQSTSYFDNWVSGQYTGDITNITNKITALSGDFGDYYKKTETSSKDEINDALQYVSANAGKVYEGVSPIVVNNVEDKISADTWTFSAGANVSFVDNNVDKVTRIDVELPPPQDLSYISAQVDSANAGVDYLSGVVITALPSDMATTGDIADLAQSVSETYQTKGDYLVRSDSANFYPMDGNPSGFLTAHQSLDGYATQDWVTAQGYITGVDLSEYAKRTDVLSSIESATSGKLDVSSFASVSSDFLTTAFEIPQSAKWEVASTTVQTNSSVWNDKLDVSSLDLSFGNPVDFGYGITGAYKISGADILASNALADSRGRVITGWYQLKDDNLLSGTKYGTLRIDNENTHLVDTTFSALSSYNGTVISAIPESGVGFYTGGMFPDNTKSTTSHSYSNVLSYSINIQSWDSGFTAQINGTNYNHSYFDGNNSQTITGEFESPSTLNVSLYRGNTYMNPQINQFDLGVEGQTNVVVDIRDVFTTNEQLNTASSFLSGAIDYVSANVGGGGTTYTGDAQGALDEVYANSGNWNDITAYQNNSANYLTAIPNDLDLNNISANNVVFKTINETYQGEVSTAFSENLTDYGWAIGCGISTNTIGYSSLDMKLSADLPITGTNYITIGVHQEYNEHFAAWKVPYNQIGLMNTLKINEYSAHFQTQANTLTGSDNITYVNVLDEGTSTMSTGVGNFVVSYPSVITQPLTFSSFYTNYGNTSAMLSGAIDYVSANIGGGDFVPLSSFNELSSNVNSNSGTWNDVENKLYISSYHELTAGTNIDIQNYVISSKDWTNDIADASANAYNEATALIPTLNFHYLEI